MVRIGESGKLIKCSFCGKSVKQVQRMVAGPGVHICNECVDLCCEIIDETAPEEARKYTDRPKREIPISHWIDSAERRETIRLVDEAKMTLEHILNLLALQLSSKDS